MPAGLAPVRRVLRLPLSTRHLAIQRTGWRRSGHRRAGHREGSADSKQQRCTDAVQGSDVGDDFSQPPNRVTRPLDELAAQHHTMQGRGPLSGFVTASGYQGVISTALAG